MFGFFLKKNFCDIWDNLFHTIAVNLVIVAAGFLCFVGVVMSAYLPGAESFGNIYTLLAIGLMAVVVSILIFAEGENAAKIVNFEGVKISKFFKNIVPSIKDGALFGLFITLLVAVSMVSIPYYFRIWVPADGSRGSMIGLVMMSIVFWFVVISILALQWFLPIRSFMHNGFGKCLKKSYIILFDNMLFTVGVGLVNLVNIAIMIFSMGVLNGPASMAITTSGALKLRLYKYDWYEVNPGMTKEQRRDVPWQELIEKDKRILGPRKWKSFIFPWKE